MTAIHAAYVGLAFMLAVSTYAAYQLGKGLPDNDVRMALALNLSGAGIVWLRTDKPIEGTILVVVSMRHGITAADTLSVLPVSLIVMTLRPLLFKRTRSRRGSARPR